MKKYGYPRGIKQCLYNSNQNAKGGVMKTLTFKEGPTGTIFCQLPYVVAVLCGVATVLTRPTSWESIVRALTTGGIILFAVFSVLMVSLIATRMTAEYLPTTIDTHSSEYVKRINNRIWDIGRFIPLYGFIFASDNRAISNRLHVIYWACELRERLGGLMTIAWSDNDNPDAILNGTRQWYGEMIRLRNALPILDRGYVSLSYLAKERAVHGIVEGIRFKLATDLKSAESSFTRHSNVVIALTKDGTVPAELQEIYDDARSKSDSFESRMKNIMELLRILEALDDFHLITSPDHRKMDLLETIVGNFLSAYEKFKLGIVLP